ncbi:MAG: PQQ-like beta-propeller repeat protein [Phycisphaerae bacterium]
MTRLPYMIRVMIALAGLAGCLVSLGMDWPNWRGPKHDGISPEKGFKKTWDSRPRTVWEAPLGPAFSSFTCVGDRLYTCGTKDGQQVLFCLDAATGAVVWEKAFEKGIKDRQGGDGTRATPTLDDGKVYILGGNGTLLCADAAKGGEIWKKEFKAKPTWGYSGSVLIEGDMAVVSPGGSDGALLALNKKTGEVIWKTGNEGAGYATPYPFTFNDTRYIVGFLGKSAIIVEAKTGREVWRTGWKTSYDVNASSPIFHDGYLFLTSGYGTGCALYKLSPKGDKLDGQEVWRSKVIVNKFQSCVLHEGALYGSDEKTLKCVDFMTGKELWSVPRQPNATVLLADGQLIVLTENGKLMIAPVSPKEFKPTAEADILENRCWTIPLLHEGKLYARNLEKAVCVDLREAKN